MRSRTPLVSSATLALLGFVLAACGGGGASRQDVVQPIVSDAVPSRFADFGIAAADTAVAVDDWCAGKAEPPVAGVEQLRAQWYATKPFWSGPVMERRAQFTIDDGVDPDGVDALLATSDPVDSASLRTTVGAKKRGLSALAYLLTGEPDERRCAYASGIADLVAEEAAAVGEAWLTYGNSSVTDDMTANDALRDIVSNADFAARQVVAGNTPELDEALLEGARWAILGEGPDTELHGITELLDDDTIDTLTEEFDAGDAEAIDTTLATDVVGQLGLTLNFSDADGDGG